MNARTLEASRGRRALVAIVALVLIAAGSLSIAAAESDVARLACQAPPACGG